MVTMEVGMTLVGVTSEAISKRSRTEGSACCRYVDSCFLFLSLLYVFAGTFGMLRFVQYRSVLGLVFGVLVGVGRCVSVIVRPAAEE